MDTWPESWDNVFFQAIFNLVCYFIFASIFEKTKTQTTPNWKTIDTAPKDREIMVTDGTRVSFAIWTELFVPNLRGEKFVWKCREWGEAVPTHWDELPRLP